MAFTVREICQKIWYLEEKYELNHKKIQNCYPWQLIRMYLYYEISRKTNVFESAQQSSLSPYDKAKSFMPFIKNSVLSNPLKGKEKVDFLIFDHPRKIIFKGEYQDIYSYFLMNALNELGINFETIETPYLNHHFTSKENQKRNHVKFNDRILLGSFIHKTRNRGKLPFTNEERQLINEVKGEIESLFKIEVNLFGIIEDHILNFQYEYKKYMELLQKKGAKKVFIVVAYENKALIAACKRMNVKVIELQHGTISHYHLGYSYPENTQKMNGKIKEIEYFPDYILSFGDYWKNACAFPIENKKIISIGFPYFEENSKDFMKISKDKNKNEMKEKQILFISQGVIGKYLSKLAYEMAKGINGNSEKEFDNHPDNTNNKKKLDKTLDNINNEKKLDKTLDNINNENNKDYKNNENNGNYGNKGNKDNNENNAKYQFIYKLHPGECGTWRENYKYLNKAAQEFDNFKVIDKSEPPLYQLFAESHYQIGAFSTAIYEGLAFNCKTFTIDIPGVEYMDDLISKDIVKKVKIHEELIDYIINDENQQIKFKEYDRNYFFKPYDEKIFKRILSD